MASTYRRRSRRRAPKDGMIRMTVELRDGGIHVFERDRKPRYWKSWVMDQMPYGTDYFACQWRIERVRVGGQHGC